MADSGSLESGDRNGQIVEWQVLADNKPVYEILSEAEILSRKR